VQFVVTDQTSSSLLELASDFRPSRRALDARTGVGAATGRFVTSLVVRDEGIPAPLAVESFLLPGNARRGLPVVHLQKAPVQSPVPGTTLLVAETLVDTNEAQAGPDLSRLRAAVVAVVASFLPFIERQYLLIDSPHDGLPLWDYRSGKKALVDRALVRATGGSIDAEPMSPQLSVDDASLAGLGGEPLRFPLSGAFGVGKSILPALGQEGELLAAWGTARTITRTDRRKEKMRREMWSKVELA
jgi:hypothetical protein